MIGMDGKWTDRLRKRMQDFEEPEPEGLWQAVSDAMDKSGTAVPVRKPAHAGRKASGFSKYVMYATAALSAAAAILLAVRFGFNDRPVLPADDNDIVAVAADTAPERLPDTSRQKPTEDGIIVREIHAAASLIAENRQTVPVQAGRNDISETDGLTDSPVHADNETIREQEAVTDALSGTDDTGDAGPESAVTDNAAKEMDTCRQHDGGFDGKEYADADRGKKRRARGAIHASISSSNLVGSVSSFSGYGGLSSVSALSAPLKEKEEIVETRAAAVQQRDGASGSGNQYNTEIHHRQPVRVGVSVRYDFTKRWGIETGLTYSMLSSTITTGGSGYSSRTEQELHYIGIPLQVSYDFLQLKWFSLYVNAGGMIEKCISGKAVASYVPEGESAFESREGITARPLQWSLNAAIGAEVHFTPLIGLYVEPGASYFFNDGSGISTIYKERPLNFNFEFGLRFTFR